MTVPYAAPPSFVQAFHGCDHTVADRVISGRQRLRASRNDYDWLGAAIYFWESDATRAFEWARELRRRGTVRRPAVIGAVVDLGQCLNLLDWQYLKLVASDYEFLKVDARRTGTPMPRNRAVPGSSALLLRDLDCATIKNCRELQIDRGGPPFDTVRVAFIEGEPLHPGAGFNNRNHIQLCVVSSACRKGYFRPLAGGTV